MTAVCEASGFRRDLLLARLGRCPGCMSMPPLKVAPSAMATRGALMSPLTVPPLPIEILSAASILPATSPRTTTDLADTCA